MKKFFFVPASLVLIALGDTGYLSFTLRHDVPAIAVSLQSHVSGGTQYLPAIDGYASGVGMSTSHGTKEDYQAAENYRVFATANGHFAVMAHYVIERNGVSNTVDRLLPVRDQEPNETQWAKLDPHLFAYAYLSKSTLAY